MIESTTRSHHHRRRRAQIRPPTTGERLERHGFDAALLATLVATPIAMGGRHPVGQALLTLAAGLATLSWLMRAWEKRGAEWRCSLVDGLFALGLLVGLVQIVPLPNDIVAAVSPHLAEVLPCWSGGPLTLGRWNTLSLTPGETLTGIQILLAQAIFVAILFQRVRQGGPQEAERVLTVVAAATGLLAMLGVVQYLAGNGKYLWVYEFVHNDAAGMVKGTFTNRNHYASFLAIGAGAVAWWSLFSRPAKPPKRRSFSRPDPLASQWRLACGMLVLAAVAFAALSSLSRGGMLALATAAAVSLGLLLRARVIRPLAAVGIVTAAGGVFLALQIHGLDRVENRLDTLFDERHQETGFGRLEVWRAATRAIADFPWLGTGVGSHADISQRYMPATDTTVFTHAENSYLNLGVEAGAVGLGVAALAICAAIVSCVIVFRGGDERQQGIAAAIAAALAAGLVHAGTDFIWYVPAISTSLAALAACGMALASRRWGGVPSISLPLGRPAAALAACGACAMLVASGARQLSAARAEPAWEESIRQARELAREAGDWLKEQSPDHPDHESARPARLLAVLDERIATLETVTALRPDHPRAWGALAVARLERFGLARRLAGAGIGLADLRQVATDGSFATPEDVWAWARNAVGPNYQQLEQAVAAAGRAVTVSPLDGEAWCALASIAFLTSPDPSLHKLCIDQALLVRPKNSLVLFEAANQAALDGDQERAIELWRTSFAVSGGQRTRILSILRPLVPATEAAAMLAPDLAGLRAIDAMWSRTSTVEEMRPIREQRLEAALIAAADEKRSGSQAGLLMEAAGLQRTLGDLGAARATLQSAIAAQPSNYQAHLTLADLAMQCGEHDVADRELEWCRLRRPDSEAVRTRQEKLARLRAERIIPVSHEQP